MGSSRRPWGRQNTRRPTPVAASKPNANHAVRLPHVHGNNAFMLFRTSTSEGCDQKRRRSRRPETRPAPIPKGRIALKYSTVPTRAIPNEVQFRMWAVLAADSAPAKSPERCRAKPIAEKTMAAIPIGRQQSTVTNMANTKLRVWLGPDTEAASRWHVSGGRL